MKTKLIYILFAFIAIASSCQKSEFLTDGDFFHLSNKGADMPVWVKGNFESDIILVTVHGGPGASSGMEHHIAEGFKFLEEDYILVYWDQRYSGMTQDHYDITTQNPEQYIEDTEKLVQLIMSKYPGKSMFMLGHSWGGQLSAGYLGRDNHADNFKGWIDMDGSIYGELEAQLMKEWILERVPEKLAKPDADAEYLEYWQFIVDWYEENPNPGNYSASEPYWYVSALGGDAYDWESVQEEFPIPYVELIFKSMFAMSFYNNSYDNYEEFEAWDKLNFTPELKNITIPALMLWGENDGIVPTGVAHYVYDNLGTSPDMKEVVLIPKCGHGPQHETPETFYQEVSKFMETYK